MTPEPLAYRIAEVAQMLHVSKPWVWERYKEGTLKGHQPTGPGGAVIIFAGDLEAFLHGPRKVQRRSA